MSNPLNGYVAAITGASSGIGAATARALVGRGARVVLGARRVDRVQRLAEELGADALAVELDVRSPEAAERFAASAVDAFGRIDGLIATGGTGY